MSPATSTSGKKKHTESPSDPTSAAARIRDNQRRSRARHREFVEELKAKVRHYESQGVQATLDMRQVARKVALENARLRALLASRGVTQEDVDHYLASSSDGESGVLHTIDPALGKDGMPGIAPAPLTPASTPASALDTLAVVAEREACCGPATHCSPDDSQHISPHFPQPSYPEPSVQGQPPSPRSENAAASHLEMSCTTAAQIMASMYQDGNKDMARKALGCSGSEECLVKNTLVFQLLDSAETG
ncbi:hypothetical protein C8A05DRAFT_34958 [Staphylotrichum tortipilum]|uniref:BZIP domain-containing protein n=1 Tax=Staphylotrichum tortipilum TaxID=2831512 RepID=A0AAN6RSY1_9PEZI|nr:hypothetical protein C8A05DRAFT_34958 [Staphylotrichum longicolle]